MLRDIKLGLFGNGLVRKKQGNTRHLEGKLRVKFNARVDADFALGDRVAGTDLEVESALFEVAFPA